jgi:dihydroorotase
VRGGIVVDETGERRADVLVVGGYIAAVGEGLTKEGTRVLDAGGCLVAPGLVDLHTHLREPGAEDAECIESGARAASVGGFTAVTAMPNTDPPIDDASVAMEVLTLGKAATCQVGVAGAITVGRRGECLAPLGELAELGVRLFTDDGAGVQDNGLMRRAFEYARGLTARGLPVVLAQHCEDRALAGDGAMNEGAWSSRLGVPGVPAEAEELMVARDIVLARMTSGRIHFLHLSSERSAALVAEAKASGVAVSAEVSPHHLSLTDAELVGYDPLFKVNPPLRTARDVAALRAACGAGVVDAIATDHAPHVPEAKDRPLEEAPPGMLGLETALSVAVGALCRGEPAVEKDAVDESSEGESKSEARAGGRGRGRLTEREVFGLMSWGPARIAGLALSQGGSQGGPLSEGAPANICVFDPTEAWVVDPARLASKSRNSPWAGRRLTGRVRHTVYEGEPVVIDAVAQR